MNGGTYKGTQILKESTISTILRINNPASGTCLIWVKSLGNWYGHSGGEPGVDAQVEFYPEKKTGLIIFSNKRTGMVYPGQRIHAMIRRIAEGYL